MHLARESVSSKRVFETLERCTGFLGVVCSEASLDRINDSGELLGKYFEDHKEVLEKLEIRDRAPRVYGGRFHEISSCWGVTRKRTSDGSEKIEKFDEDEYLYSHPWLNFEDESKDELEDESADK